MTKTNADFENSLEFQRDLAKMLKAENESLKEQLAQCDTSIEFVRLHLFEIWRGEGEPLLGMPGNTYSRHDMKAMAGYGLNAIKNLQEIRGTAK